jgi:integrase
MQPRKPFHNAPCVLARYHWIAMAVFRRTYKDSTTGKTRKCKTYNYDFFFHAQRHRGSTDCTTRTRAKVFVDDLRKRLERGLVGLPVEQPEARVRTVRVALDEYEPHYAVDHTAASVAIVKERGAHLRRLLGQEIAASLREARIQKYREQRIAEGAGGRTIDLELSVLSRAFGAKWSTWWPTLKPLDKGSTVGKRISPDDESVILEAAAKEQSPYLYTYLVTQFRTGFRPGETRHLQWHRFVLGPSHHESYVRVGKSKTKSGENRDLPIDRRLWATMVQYRGWYQSEIGDPQPNWYVFPFGNLNRIDPTRPITNIKKAWQRLKLRLKAKLGVNYRLHDMRHTLATKMAIAGVPDAKRRYLMGQVSEDVISRYTHLQAENCRADLERALAADEVGTKSRSEVPTVSTTVTRGKKKAATGIVQ